ncbi:hypothetical protein M436DRAFT_79093 [Aureobasidium namibiae CBS 147.97]|uniref:Uncharacterized protein n=1 Tax=Aureobasidium namibiae CBS 147.97 TaxID=1043004 RepID=A0A074XML8_9PEZI
MDLPLRPAAPSSIPLRVKPALTTLPIEIKNEIFSHLLLGEKVKYFEPGTVLGYAYAFQMKIARTNKQLYKEANGYLRTHNDFALVHLKYPRLVRNLSPHVAVGNGAESFKDPAIEATVEDLEPKDIYIINHRHKDFHKGGEALTQHVIFLAQDLSHFCRYLQLDIHTQKRYLDELLSHGHHGSEKLRCAYVMVAKLVHSPFPIIGWYNTAFLFKAPYRWMPARPLSTTSFQGEAELCMASPWLKYAYVTALECLLNAMSLALDDGDFELLSETCGVTAVMVNMFHLRAALSIEQTSLIRHYRILQGIFTKVSVARLHSTDVDMAMRMLDPVASIGEIDYLYRKEDFDYLKSVFEHTLSAPNTFHNFDPPGLKRRKRTFTDPLVFNRPSDMYGWTSDTVRNLSPGLKKSIIEHSDAAIKSKDIVSPEKTGAEGHVMLNLYDGTPPEGFSDW